MIKEQSIYYTLIKKGQTSYRKVRELSQNTLRFYTLKLLQVKWLKENTRKPKFRFLINESSSRTFKRGLKKDL